ELFRGLIISHSHFPLNFNGLDEQLVESVKRQLLVSQGEETVIEILNSLQFRYGTTSHVGVQIWVRYRKHLCSRYKA
ncbi:unnamed protein product, partial [Hymenolepis diminuta]